MNSIPLKDGSTLIAQLANEGRYPVLCQWEITCRCNFKCVMCYTDCFNTPTDIARELSTDEIFKIMDEMREAGVLELILTGGEPMARPDFREIYLYAVRFGFLTTVYTNGTFITPAWITLWQEFRPRMIEISFHGATPETFDRVTAIPKSFQKVSEVVRLVAEAGLPLTIKATGLTLNHHEIRAIKDQVRGFPSVHFRLGTVIRPLADGDNSPAQYQLSDEIINELIRGDEELRQDEKRQFYEDNAMPHVCHEGKNRFHIDAYGQLQLCSGNRKKSYRLRNGNFKEGFYNHLPGFPCFNKTPSANSAGAQHVG